MVYFKPLLLGFVGLLAISALTAQGISARVASVGATSSQVVVYSARTEPLILPLFQKFEKDTGIHVVLVTDQPQALIEKIKAQKDKVQADLLLTVDAGNLHSAQKEHLLAPFKAEDVNSKVPVEWRDKNGEWFGLSLRARTLFFNPQKVKRDHLTTYEDLADPRWKGKLCLRTSNKVYNQSLVATMMARLGEKKAEEVVRGWVANLATPVFSSDNQVLEAVASGQCAVGIANTYYFARMKAEKPDVTVEVFWPNQNTSGVHVNISGAGIVKGAPHRAEAEKLLRYLLQPEAQKVFSESNYEYPVTAGIPVHPLVKDWGEFKKDATPLAKAGELQAKAVQLMDRAGYR